MHKSRSKLVQARIHIRDVERTLFSYLFLNKVATSKQIARDIFTEMSHQALYKRLNLLIDHGYLVAKFHRDLGGRLIYSLSDRGFKEFAGEIPKDIRKQVESDSPIHDLDLLDIRHCLKKLSSVTKYYTENVLRSGIEIEHKQDLIPFKALHVDAVLRLNRQGAEHWLALEYERTLKFSSRYLTYFQKLYASPGVPGVLYIAGDDNIRRRIEQIERQVLALNWPKVFYSTVEKVLQVPPTITFENINKEKITLR